MASGLKVFIEDIITYTWLSYAIYRHISQDELLPSACLLTKEIRKKIPQAIKKGLDVSQGDFRFSAYTSWPHRTNTVKESIHVRQTVIPACLTETEVVQVEGDDVFLAWLKK